MKKIIIISFVMFGMIISSTGLLAKFSLNGQFKPRYEYRDGYKLLTNDDLFPASFVSQRTRLNFDYSNSNITSRISAQDVRVWGDEVHLKNTPSIALHEAWVDLKLDTMISLKVGRQELVYDDHRILGNVDWAQEGRSHDAFVGKYESSNMKIHLGGAFNQSGQNLFSTNYAMKNYKGMGFLWFENIIDTNMRFTLLGITDAFQENDTNNYNYFRYTFGGNYYYTSQSLEIQGTGYYQLGQTVKAQDISAYMFSLQAHYKFNGFKVGAGIDYLSGNDSENPGTNEYTAFNTLYGTNHKFYGLMDHFIDIPANTAGGGLVDIYANIKYDFMSKWNANLDFHSFSLEKAIINPITSSLTEKGLASEIDLVLTHTLSSDIKFQIGYSYLIPADALKIVQGRPNGENSQWLWAMLIVTPEFFSSN
ncbi:MAG: hypothetical protein CVV25_05655 [Ignavibacteriae bacterium HGW-Ignavibacteriae-4]|jgi:hypothetical protein|nr:MAG: hypothetical protein CVV25_05655 [Ignavibacteriae bacterium HGW-Ignavibacteriae-4]